MPRPAPTGPRPAAAKPSARRRLRLAELPRRSETAIDWEPTPEERVEMARRIDVPSVRKLRLQGTLHPRGKGDWHLAATLGATAMQECVVTLEPVTSRVDAPVARTYLADWHEPEEAEAEMPEDDSLEPLPDTLDLFELAAEALALALPDYPRAPGTEEVELSVTEPGKTPLSDDDVKPFAGLRELKDRMGE
ncbi:YceD family protein [Wenxinia saemankumensis]|uniref:Uncharacterized ACR, COG1399 n=1 Tax=Wenxinia saemankumensis TaxID=1447782 RepID=A0A1M6A3V9_9RHOB|nr:YceD family protein [Wenxinia saemankumensis]SHI31182.1 Uncharacterized ACR, COG1399 [Wenxinia saemankumensis]